MSYILDKYGPDGFDAVYSHNDSMTLGAIDVLERSGVCPGTDVIMISVDGEAAAVQLLKAGKINCIVQCSPYLGENVMELVGTLKSGNPVPKISHPNEGVFCDFDDLTDPAMEGF